MTSQNQRKNQNPRKLKTTFGDHLDELKSRLFFYFLFLILGSILGYLLHPYLLEILVKPLNQPIFYTSPSGGFEFAFQLSIFFGFLFSLPVLIYQIIKFIEPSFAEASKGQASPLLKIIWLVIIASCFLLISGILFAYFISLPAALYFLNKFSNDQIQSLISTKEYFIFVTRYLIGFGLIFQLPLILLAINTVHQISFKTLLKKEKWVILICFILAAFLTPTPDILNQIMMVLPMILLYQIAVFLIWIVNKNKTN